MAVILHFSTAINATSSVIGCFPDPTAISRQNVQIPSVFPDPTAISHQNSRYPLCCHVINLPALFPFHCQTALNM